MTFTIIRMFRGRAYPVAAQLRQFSDYSSALSTAPRINAKRLDETLHYTCQWGSANRYGNGDTDTGMSRLALSDDDARARRWFAEETAKLGCEVTVDKMGNQFARRAGSLRNGAPMIAMGSHLDTQPRGGRYDGILGVMAGIEALKTLNDANYETGYDIGVVNWTNEEGARFPVSMVSSGVWAGKIPLEKAWNLADIFDPSVTIRSELDRHGFIGQVDCSSDAETGYPLSAHFELHIEQGPILEKTGKRIGVVQGAQAYKWITVTLTGRDAHTGTTPLHMRSDPLLAAAKMIVSSNAIARGCGALASTGVMKIPTNASTNTIASAVSFSLDIRHPDTGVVADTLRECIKSFNSICTEDGKGVTMSWTLDTDSAAVEFDEGCIKAIEMAAKSTVGSAGWAPLTSGAGHDSVYTSTKVPTAMVFVPCRNGISHHPEEYCSPEDCALGAQTLLEAVVNYDNMLSRKSNRA